MATAAVEEEEMQYAAYEEEEDGVEERWQCRLCFASLYGSERIEAHGALAPPSLREALNLSSGLSAVAGALPLLCRREFMSTSGLEAAAPAAAPAPAPALAAVPAAATGVAEGRRCRTAVEHAIASAASRDSGREDRADCPRGALALLGSRQRVPLDVTIPDVHPKHPLRPQLAAPSPSAVRAATLLASQRVNALLQQAEKLRALEVKVRQQVARLLPAAAGDEEYEDEMLRDLAAETEQVRSSAGEAMTELSVLRSLLAQETTRLSVRRRRRAVCAPRGSRGSSRGAAGRRAARGVWLECGSRGRRRGALRDTDEAIRDTDSADSEGQQAPMAVNGASRADDWIEAHRIASGLPPRDDPRPHPPNRQGDASCSSPRSALAQHSKTESAASYLHSAHLLDLPSAAMGRPPTRLPLPLGAACVDTWRARGGRRGGRREGRGCRAASLA